MNLRNKQIRSLVCLLCTFLLLLFPVSAIGETAGTVTNFHAIESIFDGYSGVETTTFGELGYNFAILCPDGKKELLFGFNPQNTFFDTTLSSFLGSGLGWDIKLPHIEFSDGQAKLYNSRGHRYPIQSVDSSHNLRLLNYPSAHTLSIVKQNNISFLLLSESYGKETYFSLDGKPLKTVDEFNVQTEYIYDADILSEIRYSDNSFILFLRDESSITLEYCHDDETFELASFYFEEQPDGYYLLSEIDSYCSGHLFFEYTQDPKSSNVLLKSYELQNDHTCYFEYQTANTSSGHRILSLQKVYADGEESFRNYSYNLQGRIKNMRTGENAQISYSYSNSINGSLTVTTTKNYNDKISVSTKTINDSGQIVRYSYGNSNLQLEYNDGNRVSKITENGTETLYEYNYQGLVDTTFYSDGETAHYQYRPDGTLKKRTKGEEVTLYDQNGFSLGFSVYSNPGTNLTSKENTGSMQNTLADQIEVVYNINNDVGVTNYIDIYNLTEYRFNCYTFAIAYYTYLFHPGHFCENEYQIYDSISALKMAVEEDQDSIGRYTYDATENESISGHEWKISFRIRRGSDYHFMKKSVLSPWMFKAGQTGPVMQLLNGNAPSDISWDTYDTNSSGKYVVTYSGFYTSAIDYLIIED